MTKKEWVKKGPGLYQRYSPAGDLIGWYGWYTDHRGRQVRRALYAISKRDAQAKLDKLKVESKDSRKYGNPRLDPDLTVKTMMMSYHQYALDNLKPRSAAHIKTSCKPLIEFFGNTKAVMVGKDDIEAYTKSRRNQPRTRQGAKRQGPLSGSTINREVVYLKCAYNRAIDLGLLEKNPVPRRKPFKELARDRILSDAEYQALLDHCTDHLKLIVQVAATTGMRRSEVENLQWARVDLQQGLIKLLPEDTKTSEGRTIPLTQELLHLFRELKASQVEQIVDMKAAPYVFRRLVGRIYKKVGSTKKSFDTARKAAGLDDIRFHDLRRTAITNMRRAGLDARLTMAISGHKTYAMMQRYDQGPRVDELQEAVMKLSGAGTSDRISDRAFSKVEGAL